MQIQKVRDGKKKGGDELRKVFALVRVFALTLLVWPTFGKHDHNYKLPMQLRCRRFSLPHLMMRYDEAALAQRRDAAPLRRISWLTFGLPKWLQV